MEMFEVQFRRIINEEASQYNTYRTWHELGYFKNIALAMECILHEINITWSNMPDLKLKDFEFSHISEGYEVHELPCFEPVFSWPDKESSDKNVWQFRFAKTILPDSPWKIGLNDND